MEESTDTRKQRALDRLNERLRIFVASEVDAFRAEAGFTENDKDTLTCYIAMSMVLLNRGAVLAAAIPIPLSSVTSELLGWYNGATDFFSKKPMGGQ